MTPDPAAADAKILPMIPSTAGMTTKVIKGSVWTLGGQVLPMAVSLFTTPFVIRFLGSEQYGVLILVTLIPAYFGFADLGMGIASTKFGSEAFSQGDSKKEGEVVRTSALVAFVASVSVALPMFLLSGAIIAALNVPQNLQETASTALKITSASFLLGILASVLNTPQLSRLRMDLHTIITSVPKVFLTVATPFVLYLGFGIVGVVIGLLIATVAILGGHIYVSGKLLPELYSTTWNKELLKPLLKFGGGLFLAALAAILLVNFEKLALTRLVSVRSLAYYSVAFMFANLAATFSAAMIQSLVPAFSQLSSPEKKEQFDSLFSRSVRLNLIWLVPVIVLMALVARPFFTFWAGEEFGRESTVPFYILLFGLFFNILAYVPHSAITARGGTGVFAKLYWIELPLYIAAVIALVYYFGIVGAAIAWSLRVFFDAFFIVWYSKSVAGVTFKFLKHLPPVLISLSAFIPVLILAAYDNFSLGLLLLVPVSAILYAWAAWKAAITSSEKLWIKKRLTDLLSFRRRSGS